MGLFSRKGRDSTPAGEEGDLRQDPGSDLLEPEADDDWSRPLGPRALPLRADHLALRDRCLSELATAGVDLDDLGAIGVGYDADCAAWVARGGLKRSKPGDQDPFIQRWGSRSASI